MSQAPSAGSPKPSRATLIGLLIGTGLALVAAMGPLVSAITITVGVETQVGDSSGLPDARMLPAALEGVGAVALIFLLTRRPEGGLRAWAIALIFVSLATGMAAQGAHAVWYDENHRHLELPWDVKLLVSFVPPVSGLATLHLVVTMAEDLITNVRVLLAEPAPNPDADARPAPGRKVDAWVLRILRANPHATWRVISDRLGVSESVARRALSAARQQAQAEPQDASEQPAAEAVPAHANGRS